MSLNFPKNEEKILKFWKEKKIFEKLTKTRKGAKNFVFYEGPPYANGLPGIHHFLARAFKDIVCRYKTMQGFMVVRKAGWDTHGLPTEMEVEKKLGIKTKKEIEKLGIKKFIEECKKSIFIYKKEWEKFTERIAYWLDLKNPYITCDNEYMESVWWIISQIWKKGLLYQDYKVVPYCPRCGTPLSSHEVAQGYKKIKEPAIYIKFKVKPKTYFLAWTTTPWTLLGNVALAVNPKFVYVKVKVGDEYLILAKKRVGILGKELKIVEKFKGKDLAGLKYEPLYKFGKPEKEKKVWEVIPGDFVSVEEGTGIVHTAVAYGIEDFELGKEQNLAMFHLVDEEGRFKKAVTPWAGMFVKEADPKIIENLKKRNILFREESFEHEYPFCWRCGSPLLYYAKKSWFVNMQKVKKDLIRNNQKINWVPSYLREGRFGGWLKEVKDWALSRERYWGIPLPIWDCRCGQRFVIGSIKELEKLSGQRIKDLHKPKIDEITIKCLKCKKKAKRVPEVLDVWFDSGAMPFAQYHYPFENRDLIEKKRQFPADYICEGIDQTRGWFYTLHAISTLLGKGPAFKNVISVGLVLDKKGEKMSKSKGNIVDPWETIRKYSVDSVRWYFFTINQSGDSKCFSEKGLSDCFKRFIMTFWNCYSFFDIYKTTLNSRTLTSESKNSLDKWIISRLNALISQVTKDMDNYKIKEAADSLENFVIEDLSHWYIRRSRKRFQESETENEKKEAISTLGYVLLTLSKLTAPFIPFLSEEIYLGLRSKKMPESVHLSDWPRVNKEKINLKLEKKMEKIREIVSLALGERKSLGIKVRQPLASLKIKDLRFKIKDNKELLDLIKEEVNVKKVVFDKKIKKEIKLDTKITPKLKEEGQVREIIRYIQEMRKEVGLKPKHKILIYYFGPATLNKLLLKNKKAILETTKAKELKLRERKKAKCDITKETKVDGEKLYLAIKKI